MIRTTAWAWFTGLAGAATCRGATGIAGIGAGIARPVGIFRKKSGISDGRTPAGDTGPSVIAMSDRSSTTGRASSFASAFGAATGFALGAAAGLATAAGATFCTGAGAGLTGTGAGAV